MIFIWLWLSIGQLFFSTASATTMQNQSVPYQFKEGYLSAGFESSYLATSANYDDHGNSVALPAGNSFKLFKNLLYSRYDWSDRMSFYAELPISFATEEDAAETRSKTSFNGVGIGMNYDTGFRFAKFILDVRGYGSIDKWDPTVDEIQTSDGAHKFDIGAHLLKRFSSILVHGFIDYQYRSNGFSSLLKYQADAAYLTNRFSLTLGFSGYKSMTDDQYVDNPIQRLQFLNTVNGASLAEGSVNPSQMNVFLQAKLPLGDVADLYGGFSKSLNGQNISDQSMFTLGLEYFFEPLKRKKKFIYKDYREEEDRMRYEDENERSDQKEYEEDIRNYNQPPQKKKRRKKVVTPPTTPTEEAPVQQEEVAPPPPPPPPPPPVEKPKHVTPPKASQEPVQEQEAPPKQMRNKDLNERPKNYKKSDEVNKLTVTKKSFGKPKPKPKPKHKSKKPKRVRIDF